LSVLKVNCAKMNYQRHSAIPLPRAIRSVVALSDITFFLFRTAERIEHLRSGGEPALDSFSATVAGRFFENKW
jgi:hypothetical protein